MGKVSGDVYGFVRCPKMGSKADQRPVTVTGYSRAVALTSAQRQRRFRARRAAGFAFTPVPVKKSARPLPRPARWARALGELRQLQAEYQAWRDGLPEPLAESRTAELLDEVCDVDLNDLDVQLPRGFGRD